MIVFMFGGLEAPSAIKVSGIYADTVFCQAAKNKQKEKVVAWQLQKNIEHLLPSHYHRSMLNLLHPLSAMNGREGWQQR